MNDERTEREKTGGPAFPVPPFEEAGLTIRDYFAAAALKGEGNVPTFLENQIALALRCYEMADAMLKARES